MFATYTSEEWVGELVTTGLFHAKGYKVKFTATASSVIKQTGDTQLPAWRTSCWGEDGIGSATLRGSGTMTSTRALWSSAGNSPWTTHYQDALRQRAEFFVVRRLAVPGAHTWLELK